MPSAKKAERDNPQPSNKVIVVVRATALLRKSELEIMRIDLQSQLDSGNVVLLPIGCELQEVIFGADWTIEVRQEAQS